MIMWKNPLWLLLKTIGSNASSMISTISSWANSHKKQISNTIMFIIVVGEFWVFFFIPTKVFCAKDPFDWWFFPYVITCFFILMVTLNKAMDL